MIVTCHQCSTSNRVPVQRMSSRAHCGHCKALLSPSSHPIPILSREDFDELVRDAPVPVLVDFWAAWCGPCRMVAPEVEKLAREREGSLLVAKVDSDALPELSRRFSISGIPTLITFQGGREAKRMSGAAPAATIARELGL